MERYAAFARTLLARCRPDLGPSMPSDRGRLVASMEQALARRAREHRFRRRIVFSGALAAAAVVLVVGGLTLPRFFPALHGASGQTAQVAVVVPLERPGKSQVVLSGDGNTLPRSGSVIVQPGAAPQPLTHGMMLEPGIRLVAPPTNEVRIATADGTALTLEPGGELAVVEQGAAQRYELLRGAIRANVAKLRTGERFIIATEDSEVEVHGTVFRVGLVAGDPKCQGGAKTRVSVFEGTVSVTSGDTETFVRAGGQWPATCAGQQTTFSSGSAEPKDEAQKTSRYHVRKHRRARHAGHPGQHARRFGLASAQRDVDTLDAPMDGGEPAAPPPALSTLSAQNDLFAAAVRAKQQQEEGQSEQLFSRLVSTYPDGPLTEGAMVQRMKLLANADKVGAARVASEYLARFPGGFARAEARRIAGAPP
jgi:FecR protein